MSGIHFVVAIGANQKEILNLRAVNQCPNQVERSRVDPLEVVQEDHQRMLLGGKHTDKTLKGKLEAISCLDRAQGVGRRLLPEAQLHFRYHLSQNTGISSQRLRQPGAPDRQAIFTLREKLLDKAPKGLEQRPKRSVACHQVKFPGEEVAALPDDGSVKLLNEGSLANARVTGYEQEGGVSFADAVEGADELLHLLLSPVELLGNNKPVRDVVLPEHETCNALLS